MGTYRQMRESMCRWACTLALVALAVAPSAQGQGTGTVTGTVRFFETNDPVAAAPVQLISTLTPLDPPVVQGTTSDIGAYTIEAPPGAYILQIKNPPEGVLKDHLTDVLARDFITILEGEVLVYDIDDAGNDPIGQWGSVVGVVMNAQGTAAIPGASVALVSSGDGAQTDAFGVYAFAVLPIGTYQANAQAPGFLETSGSVTLSQTFEIAQLNFNLEPAHAADVNGNGEIDAQDIQLVINRVLGIDAVCACDVSGDGVIDAVDVQRAINAVLGIGI